MLRREGKESEGWFMENERLEKGCDGGRPGAPPVFRDSYDGGE